MAKKMHDFKLMHMLQKQKQVQTKGYVCLILIFILVNGYFPYQHGKQC